MTDNRLYTSRRDSIVNALVILVKNITTANGYLSDLHEEVLPILKFWDEIDDFPAVHINAGSETREYIGGGQKIRFLSIVLRCYVKEENTSVQELNKLLEDVETLIENNSRLEYVDKQGTTQFTQQITVVSIDTDEGVFDPIGVGEMVVEVRY